MSTVAIIQARMTSTRLSGKVLASIGGRPALEYMLARVRRATRLDAIWMATTDNATDDPVADLCTRLEVPIFRGDEADVLGRYVGAMQAAGADTIVRLTADCPLIDPSLIDAAILLLQEGGFDYVSNVVERSYPDGLDVEVSTAEALAAAGREAQHPYHREHVTPYLRTGAYDDLPTGQFKVGHLHAPADFGHLRWTVDTPADLRRVQAMAASLPDDHGWMDALALVTRRPHLLAEDKDMALPITLRRAEGNDADMLLAWANASDSSAYNLRTTALIRREEHLVWLARTLVSDTAAIWIAEAGGGWPVGQIGLVLRDAALEVDIYVVPRMRGKGIAQAMLDAVHPAAAEAWPGVKLLARVKPKNKASRRLFEAAGYVCTATEPNHLVLAREKME